MDTQTVAHPGAVALEPPSTVLNPETVKTTSGAGAPDLSRDDSGSIESVLDAELSRLKAEDTEKAEAAKNEAKAKLEDAEKAEKAKPAAKPEKLKADEPEPKNADDTTDPAEAPADKSDPAKAAAGKDGQDRRQSEGRQHHEPPSRFLPEARAKWANVPNEVKAEFHRVAAEMEQENSRFKTAHERYEPIRQFDDIARTNGRELKDSLAKVVQVERALATDLVGGLDMILREIGPRKQDGSALTIHDVVGAISQRGVQQTYQAPQQPGPEVAALSDKVSELETQIAWQTHIQPMLDRFAADKNDFHELWPAMQDLLSMGVIEKLYGNGLSPEQKLEQAYRMAGGSPLSRSGAVEPAAHFDAGTMRPVDPDAGKKSIRGAPADGADTIVPEPDQSLDELIRKELRKARA